MTRQVIRGVLVVLLVGAAATAGYLVRDRLARPAPAESAKAGATSSLAEALQGSFVGVAEHVRPAVVHIGTIQRAKPRRPPVAPPGTDDPYFRDFFNQFFGSEGPDTRSEFRRPGLGSGVIIDKRGLVLTNFHVVKGADEILIRLADKHEYRGQILGTDAKTDLAVVRFQPDHELPVAILGNSDALRVGEWAIAIGNPFGLDQTVTVGVISATGRSDVGVATYENFIQTDASINPGNSGGPLLNLKGEVVGINTAIVAAGQGIGFAIPINMVKRVVGQLVDSGKVVRGWIGVGLQPLSPELAQTLGVTGAAGAVVSSTIAGGPAEKAGLQQGDVVLSYDKVPVEDYRHMQRLVAETKVGKSVALEVLRKKQKIALSITIAEVPDEGARRSAGAPARK
ncbi:MAG TPA: trypsin-like peptidase domain-containing protein [Methylomirabilota bacterium]|nr:trypsin-like peptidase domain-containing protein [Methylomirabilota bacterium]